MSEQIHYFPISKQIPLHEIDAGTTSQAYCAELPIKSILKITPTNTYEQTINTVRELEKYYDLARKYLEPHIPRTEFFIGNAEVGYNTYQYQDYVPGLRLRDVNFDNLQKETQQNLLAFFTSCLNMYHKTGYHVDIYTNKYRFMQIWRSKNVIVQDNSHQVSLVDFLPAYASRNKKTSSITNALQALATSSFLVMKK